jgi:hypothetical protein
MAVVMVDSAIRYSMERWSANGDDAPSYSRDIERTIDMMAEMHRQDS